jgi:hypothetical protein
MDSVMMLLVIAALWLTVRAAESSSRPRRAIVLAGVALGLAFNVKLLEALIAAPALVVLYLLARPDQRATVEAHRHGARRYGAGRRRAELGAARLAGARPPPLGRFAISMAVWIAFGLLAFDTMHTVHARYLEAPALAATIGFGGGVAGRAGWPASQPERSWDRSGSSPDCRGAACDLRIHIARDAVARSYEGQRLARAGHDGAAERGRPLELPGVADGRRAL